MRIFWKI